MKKIVLLLLSLLLLNHTDIFAQPGSMSNNTDCDGSYGNNAMTTTGVGNNNAIFTYREQANATTSSGTKFYQFNSDSYFNTWNLNTPTYNSVSTATWCGGCGYNSGIKMGATTINNYYTFNLRRGSSYANQSMSILETSYNPRSINSYTTPSSVYGGQTPTMTVTLSDVLQTNEFLYVAYSSDAFATSGNSGIASVTSNASNVYTFTLPAFSSGTVVTFYPFTSVSSSAPSYSNAPILTLNMRSSTGQNNTGAYSTYTVQTWTTIAAGDWSNPLTWNANATPSATNSLGAVTIAHNVTLNQNATVSSLTINGGATFTSTDATARTLTISKSASGSSTTLANSGTWQNGSGTSTVVFTGAPSSGDAIHAVTGTIGFQNVTVEKTGGSSNVGASFGTNSSVAGTFKIGTGGFVSTAPPTSFYGSNAILRFDQGTGATYDVGASDNSWSTSQVPNNITISSGTVNLNSSRTAPGNLLIDGGTLVLNTGSPTLTIQGNWTRTSGTFTPLTGTVALTGTTDGIITTNTAATLYNLTVNKTSSAKVTLASNLSVTNNLVLTEGALEIAGNTLTIQNASRTSGTLSGSATSNLVINGTGGSIHFTSGARTLKDLTLGSSATASLGTALDITSGTGHGVVTIGSGGTLTTGGNLTLKSDANGTAMIGNSAGSISGNVVVERFISAATNTNRAYRLLSPSVNTSGTIKANWQEGVNNTSQSFGSNQNPNAGYGTHITGSTDGSNGFDATLNGSASLFTYSAGTWNGVANTDVLTLSAKTGYLLYVRGNRGIDLSQTPAGQGSSNTTLRATGTVLNGDESFTGLSGVDTWHLLGNPFPASLNWASLSATNGTTNFYDYYTFWDPNVGSRGGYIQIQTDGTRSPNSGNASSTIQSGQAFFVRTKTAGTNSFAVNQAHKATSNTNDVFRLGNQFEKLSANIFYTGTDAIRRIADGVVAVYNNNYSSTVDDRDAEQIANWDEDVAIVREGKSLSIEKRPLVDNNDTLFFNIARLREINYEWEFTAENFNAPGLTAYVQDAFTNTETAISLSGTTVVPFTVTSNAASKAANRFRVVYRTSGVLPVTLTSVKAYQQNNGITVAWNTQSESGMQQYEVEKSANGTSFTKVNTTAAKAGTSNSYSYFDATPINGANYYRIKAISLNGDVKYSTIVVVRLGDKGTSLSVYPNPVKGNTISLAFNGLTKGNYTVSLFNQLGQQVWNRVISHNGGVATQTIDLGTLSAGLYELRLSNGATVFTEKLIKE